VEIGSVFSSVDVHLFHVKFMLFILHSVYLFIWFFLHLFSNLNLLV